MKIGEFRKKTLNELKEERIELLREQFNMRMQGGAGQSAKPHRFKQIRRDIARINTLLTEKAGAV